VDALPELCAVVEAIDDPHAGQAIERGLRKAVSGAPAARAAVSAAVHDLAATAAGEPLYRRWGLDPGAVPPTSYTVGIAAPGEMADRAARASEAGYPILKVKVGTDCDSPPVKSRDNHYEFVGHVNFGVSCGRRRGLRATLGLSRA
jgi:L-alanine-DL-glutamate epimerase-like enolase superfamily enzyme